MDYSRAIDRAIEILATWFVVMWTYYWAKTILSLRIEDNYKAFTVKGKIMTAVLCLIGSALLGVAFFFMFKSATTGLTTFIVSVPCTLIAAHHCYIEKKD